MPATPASKPHAKRPEKTPIDYLQDALDDLEKASEKAGGEVGDRIDAARERINEAREDLGDRGEDQMKQWRDQLSDAADDALRELGRWAVRAQRSPEALSDLANEIRERKAEIAT